MFTRLKCPKIAKDRNSIKGVQNLNLPKSKTNNLHLTLNLYFKYQGHSSIHFRYLVHKVRIKKISNVNIISPDVNKIAHTLSPVLVLNFKAIASMLFEISCSQGKSGENCQGPLVRQIILQFAQKILRYFTHRLQSVYQFQGPSVNTF